MAERPILYSFRRCPYAMRARLALLASETPCEIREVKLAAKPPELRAVSPKATVPVLLLADGRVIDQSLDIMRWALGGNDPDDWLGRDDPALIDANDGAFKHHLDRAKYPHRYPPDAIDHRAACVDLLAPLEARLTETAWLCGDAAGIADAAVMPFVRQFAAIDRDAFATLPLPAVQAWLARLTTAPAFEAAMVRLAPWQAGDMPIGFP